MPKVANAFMLMVAVGGARSFAQTQVFSSVQAAAPGTPMSSVDVTSSGQLAIQSLFYAYAVTPSGEFETWRQPTTFDTPQGRFGAYTDHVWALSSGKITGSPTEVFAVGEWSNGAFSPYFWGNGTVPGLPAGQSIMWGISYRSAFVASDAGLCYAVTNLQGPGVTNANRSVILSGDPVGGPRIAYRFGSDPLGRPGAWFEPSSIDMRLCANSVGGIAFTAMLRGASPSGTGILYADAAGSNIVIDPATQLPPPYTGRIISSLFSLPAINDRGEVVFTAIAQGPAVFHWTRQGGLTTLLPYQVPVPAIGPGVVGFPSDTHWLLINGRGDVVTAMTLSGPGVTSANNFMLAMVRDGRIIPIVRKGDPVPGMPGSAFGQMSTFNDYVYLDGNGQVVFRAPITGATVVGAWSLGGGVSVLAATGRELLFDGSPRTIVSVPAPNAILYGNYWSNGSGGEDGRLTLLDGNGHAYVPLVLSNSVWGVYKFDLPDPCPADITGDGFLDIFDFDAFVERFQSGENADFDHDGFIDGFDYEAFVRAFERGC